MPLRWQLVVLAGLALLSFGMLAGERAVTGLFRGALDAAPIGWELPLAVVGLAPFAAAYAAEVATVRFGTTRLLMPVCAAALLFSILAAAEARGFLTPAAVLGPIAGGALLVTVPAFLLEQCPPRQALPLFTVYSALTNRDLLTALLPLKTGSAPALLSVAAAAAGCAMILPALLRARCRPDPLPPAGPTNP